MTQQAIRLVEHQQTLTLAVLVLNESRGVLFLDMALHAFGQQFDGALGFGGWAGMCLGGVGHG